MQTHAYQTYIKNAICRIKHFLSIFMFLSTKWLLNFCGKVPTCIMMMMPKTELETFQNLVL